MTTPAKKPATKTAARATAAKPAAKAPVRRPAAPKVEAAPVVAAAPNYTKPYKMLTGIDDSEFCDKVVRHLENGYVLYGSPTSTFNGKNVIVGQAVVLAKKPKKKSGKGKKK